MNHFALFAHGVDFDVDAYIATTSLAFDKVWRRGDLRGCSEFIQDEHPTSGVVIQLGDGCQLPLHKQDTLATTFLEANELVLRYLARFPGVDTFILGLHVRIQLTPSTCGFAVSASARLLYFAFRIGVAPTFYTDLVRNDINEEE